MSKSTSIRLLESCSHLIYNVNRFKEDITFHHRETKIAYLFLRMAV